MSVGATVRYRLGRGWYVYTYRHGKQRAEKCASEAEARQVAAAVNRKSRAADSWLESGALPIDRCLTGWIETHGPELARSTEANARSLIAKQLTPYFGRMDLSTLSHEDLIAFADDRFRSGLSRSTVEGALSLLRRVCQLHLEAGLIEANPCTGSGRLVARIARRYEHASREIDAWTHEEAESLLKLALKHEKRVHGPLLCALHTGMRRGEVLGLEWRDVRPESILVRRAVVRGKVTTTKSGKTREVPVSAGLGAVLARLRAAREADEGIGSEPGPVFTTAEGGRWDDANFGRAWRRLQGKALKAKVRPLTFHAARHTFASWALDGGRSVKWVQERLGHSSAELTLRTYAHLMPAQGDELDFLVRSKPDPDLTGRDQTSKRVRSVPRAKVQKIR